MIVFAFDSNIAHRRKARCERMKLFSVFLYSFLLYRTPDAASASSSFSSPRHRRNVPEILVPATKYTANESMTLSDKRLLSTSSGSFRTPTLAVLSRVRGGAAVSTTTASPSDISGLVSTSYDWAMNLGAPSALVAGAVIATLYDARNSGDLEISKSDSPMVCFGKRLYRVLLLSAFALEVMSIFVTTVTGTMLLYVDPSSFTDVDSSSSAMSFMRDHFEFEYLTARLSFLQGLLNWLAAIALGHVIPSAKESESSRAMNRFIGSSLLTLMLLMLSFYNGHMTYYHNLPHMVMRWCCVTWDRYLGCWPPRPLALLLLPVALRSIYLGIRAFGYGQEDDGSRK